MDAVFIKKISVDSIHDAQKYIDKMSAKGISLAAWELSTSKARLSKKRLSKLESLISNNTNKLNKKDLTAFKKLLNKLKKYPATDGMIIVNQYFDTFLRELIPSDIWKAMGGINK